MLMELRLGVGRFSRQHACLSDRCDEIRVANPARHDVHVNVLSNACPCSAAQVHSDVESLWPIYLSQRRLTTLGEIEHLVGGFFGRGIKLAQMIVGHDHQVAADVGIQIENYEVVSGAMQDEVL